MVDETKIQQRPPVQTTDVMTVGTSEFVAPLESVYTNAVVTVVTAFDITLNFGKHATKPDPADASRQLGYSQGLVGVSMSIQFANILKDALETAIKRFENQHSNVPSK